MQGQISYTSRHRGGVALYAVAAAGVLIAMGAAGGVRGGIVRQK